ncbi:MAG: DNA topoisomerase [Suipraeoptans sp.]
MKLVIAEKPSLAKKIVSAIPEKFENKNGFFISSSYIVSFAFGHLFQLFELDDYDKSKWENNKPPAWDLNTLPFLPPSFKFKIKDDKGCKEQFKLLTELMNRPDVTEIVHCGDSDREGEVIIRLIIKFGLKTDKKITRLWLPEQTEENIRNQLQNLKLDSEYDNLYSEGIARTYIDWLYGINLTRYTTIKAQKLLRVGRVLTPIVKAVYERNKERESFVPVKSWKIESRVANEQTEIVLTSSKRFPYEAKSEAEHYCSALNSFGAEVVKIEQKQVKKQSPKLFSLSKLQGVLGKR